MILIGKLRGNFDSYDDRSDEGFDERRYDRRNKVSKLRPISKSLNTPILTFPPHCNSRMPIHHHVDRLVTRLIILDDAEVTAISTKKTNELLIE